MYRVMGFKPNGIPCPMETEKKRYDTRVEAAKRMEHLKTINNNCVMFVGKKTDKIKFNKVF